MKKKIKKLLNSAGPTIASLALVIAVVASNQVCAWLIGQPELPSDVKALRKF